MPLRSQSGEIRADCFETSADWIRTVASSKPTADKTKNRRTLIIFFMFSSCLSQCVRAAPGRL